MSAKGDGKKAEDTLVREAMRILGATYLSEADVYVFKEESTNLWYVTERDVIQEYGVLVRGDHDVYDRWMSNKENFGLLDADILTELAAEGVDLSHSDFSNLDLRGADLSDATLYGCDFSKANVKNVNFSGADLADCVFDGANTTGADFGDTVMEGEQ